MYPASCPKCGTPRERVPEGPAIQCARCALVFAKWVEAQAGGGAMRHRARPQRRGDGIEGDPATVDDSGWRAGRLGAIVERLTEVPPAMGTASLWAHALLLAGLFLYSWVFIFADVRSGEAWNNFLHGVNLVFHEAGHVFLMPFGQFIHVLGGTLGQLAMPLAVCISFIVGRRDPVGASVGLWWFGQSLTDCAPYIADARKLELQLLGGGTGAERGGHDWEYLLGATGLAQWDIVLGNLAKFAGGAIMIAAVAWGGWMLWQSASQGRAPRESRW